MTIGLPDLKVPATAPNQHTSAAAWMTIMTIMTITPKIGFGSAKQADLSAVPSTAWENAKILFGPFFTQFPLLLKRHQMQAHNLPSAAYVAYLLCRLSPTLKPTAL